MRTFPIKSPGPMASHGTLLQPVYSARSVRNPALSSSKSSVETSNC